MLREVRADGEFGRDAPWGVGPHAETLLYQSVTIYLLDILAALREHIYCTPAISSLPVPPFKEVRMRQGDVLQPHSPGFSKAYSEVCVNVGNYEDRLGGIDVSLIKSDAELFDKIWSRYVDIRILHSSSRGTFPSSILAYPRKHCSGRCLATQWRTGKS